MDSDMIVVVVLFGVAGLLIVAAILGSIYHVKKAKFKPKFVKFSDGSLQMEFSGFGGIQSTRTQRFNNEYQVGKKVAYQGKNYEILQIKEVADAGTMRTDLKMVCYLGELTDGRYTAVIGA